MASDTGTATYSPELVEAICDHLLAGGTVKSFCRKRGAPAERTVYKWLKVHPEFNRAYQLAREFAADLIVDEIIEIADAATDAQKARNQIASRQWAAEKMAPKKYGPRATLNHEGDVGLMVNVVRFS